jgi:glucosyl-dolichyl phosphate glucuronosyltransferase
MISVVICTYNRAQSLVQTLEALNGQAVAENAEVEIVVVNNNSRDNTAEAVEIAAKKSRWPLVYLFEKQQGLSYARNTGIKNAKGDVLAFIDDDVIPEKDWLEGLRRCFAETNADVVAGRIEMLWKCEKPEWFSNEITGPIISQNLGPERKKWTNQKQPMIGANMAFKKQLFERFGGFREDLGRKGNLLIGGEDREIFDRLWNGGCSIYYEPAAMIWHKVEEDRLSQDYFRRWFYDIGRTLGHEIVWKWHHLFTMAPLWAWKRWTQCAVNYLSFKNGNEKKKFSSEVWFRYHQGLMREKFVHWLPFIKTGTCVFQNNTEHRTQETGVRG